MAELEQNTETSPQHGEENENENENVIDGAGEEKEVDEEVIQNEAVEEEEETAKPVKKRRCQRRRKVTQICFDLDDFDDEEELEFPEDEDDEEEGEEDEESAVISYGPSVLSAISFEWENEIYEFEELCDPGNIETIYERTTVEEPTVDNIGGNRYIKVCESLNITPVMRILQLLRQNEMDLSYCNMGSKTIRAICAALEINSIVRRLIMKYNKLNAEDCRYIGLIPQFNEKIYDLDFTGCRVGPEGLELLVAHMARNEFIVDLNLSKCNIRDQGMKVLAYVLSRNNSIQSLDLSYNNLGEESGEALGFAFKMNSSVTKLILRYNNLFDPAFMKGFFRFLGLNKSVSYLDLSWNGLSGQEMASLIANYLKRSDSILYLDLSDNRFEGRAVVELKKGLAKSRTLETFKVGKNPMSPEDLDVLLSGAKGNYTLKVLDLEDLWVKKSFFKILNKIQQDRELDVRYAGVFGNYVVLGPDYPKVILQRAQFEAQKPKSEKKKKDFGHLMWTLGDEPITEEDFMMQVKKFKAKISKELFPELMKEFIIPRAQLIDVVAMRKKYLSIFPDSKPPPPPKPKKGAKVEEPVVQPEEKPVEGTVEKEVALEGMTELDEEGELMIEYEEFEEEVDIFEENEEQLADEPKAT